MKLAIQGHLTRGKEVIQILESLGGINDGLHEGNNPDCYYELHGNIIWCVSTKGINFKYYTLEEFEKEFPFKVGDVVVTLDNKSYKIVTLEYYNNKMCYKLDNGFYYRPQMLKPYKEMKKERNITLTLDKAKEWYKKDGELKEIALQAFSEKELNPLPRSWEEFCRNNPVKPSEAIICSESTIVTCDYPGTRDSDCNREICPSKKSAEAHLAMIQLEQLRNCWRQGNIPQEFKYKIKKVRNKYTVVYGEEDAFLSFCGKQTAEEFLKCFIDLIEKAGDLI